MTAIPKTLKPIDSFGLSPVVGGYYFSSNHSLDPAPIYGLRLSYDHVGKGLIDSIGVEATFNYLTTTVKNQNTKASAYLFRTDAIYAFNPRSKWVPFVALGAGGIMTDREGVRDSSPFLNFGLGIKYYFDDYLAIRADLRQLMVYSNVNTNNDFELTTGLTYYFGKERKKKAPPAPPAPPKPAMPAVPFIVEEPAAVPAVPEAPPVAAPPPDILELLGATGAAALGLNTLPPQFQPGTAPEAQPKVAAKARKSTLKEMPKTVATPKAAPVQAPVPAAPKAPQAAPAPAPAPVPVQPPVAVQAPVAPAAPPQPAPPQQQQAARQPQRSVRTLTIEFLFSSPAIRPIYQAQLGAFAALMKANTESTALIEGHTDNVGDSRSNVALSQQRAQNVKNELLKYGVDPSKVAIKGYGFSKPRASNKTNEGRQKNRRAVVTLTLVITQ